MRLRIFRGKSMSEVMAEIRAVLGDDALILSTQSAGDGRVEVTAALDDDPDLDSDFQPLVPQADRGPEVAYSRPSEHLSGHELLAWHGVPDDLARRIGDRNIESGLSSNISFGLLDTSDDSPPLLFCGPSGGGKTLAVARIATRMIMTGLRPLVITTDNSRAGTVEQLAAYTRLLGVPLISADRPEMVTRAMRHRRGGQAVLIDTAGVDPFSTDAMTRLSALRDACGGTLVLVMSAGMDPHESLEIAELFRNLGSTQMIATRLDQTRRFGGIVVAGASGIALVEAGISSAAAGGITCMTPNLLATYLSKSGSSSQTTRNSMQNNERVVQSGWGDGSGRMMHNPSALALHIAAQQRI